MNSGILSNSNRFIVVATISTVATCALLQSQGMSQEVALDSETLRQKGKTLYSQQCADCHGVQGEGVEDAHELPLVGDDSVLQLTEYIDASMPEGEPELCAGTDAKAVAAFMHYDFYSEAAQVRRRPPRIAVTRLTANQLRQSLSDLFIWFDGGSLVPDPKLKFGVEAEYFNADNWSSKKRKLERIDPGIDFDFGRADPVQGVNAKEFSIAWEAGLLAKETGRYELVVDSTCSFIFYFGDNDREFINNYVQSGDQTEFRRSIVLTAGRVYPFRIRFRQRKRKTEIPPAKISFRWVPPGGMESVIPTENLLVGRVPSSYALQAELPPDDRSYGYERGIAVSRDWDASTTEAALEFAEIAYDELWQDYRRRNRGKAEGRDLLAMFLQELVEVAIRQPLTDEQKDRYIDRQLAAEPDDALAMKRVCLVALKSAGFLYPTADNTSSQSQRVANRLALVLFDSLPSDRWLRRAAER
ncbi:MAG: PA14 domain-containing protein, partial [Planctomycetota bacterium]